MKKWILQCKIHDLKNNRNKNISTDFFNLISNLSLRWFLKENEKGELVEDRLKRKLFNKILAISFDGKNFIKIGKKTKIDLVKFWTPNYVIKTFSNDRLYFYMRKPFLIKNSFKKINSIIICINKIVNNEFKIYKEITYFNNKSKINLIDIHYSF